MKKIKIWLRQLFCDHIWKLYWFKELKRIETHPLDDVRILYAIEKHCFKCNKNKLEEAWGRREPDWLIEANCEMRK